MNTQRCLTLIILTALLSVVASLQVHGQPRPPTLRPHKPALKVTTMRIVCGQSASIQLAGRQYTKLTGLRVVQRMRPAQGVTASLSGQTHQGCKLTVTAEKNARLGNDYMVLGLIGKRVAMKLPVLVIVTGQPDPQVKSKIKDDPLLRKPARELPRALYRGKTVANVQGIPKAIEAGRSVVLTITGTNLQRLTHVDAFRGPRQDASVQAHLGIPLKTHRRLTVDVSRRAGPGTVTLRLYAGRVVVKEFTIRIVKPSIPRLPSPGSVTEFPSEPPPPPTRIAALILVENGGINLEGVSALTDLVPDICYITCASWNFDISGGETILDIIEIIGSEIIEHWECANPNNWEVECLTFEDWWEPVSDYIAEEVSDGVNSVIQRTTPFKYDKVVKLEDAEFNVDRVLSELDSLADDYQVDIHVLSHGNDECFIGHEYFYSTDHQDGANCFFAKLRQKMDSGEIPLHLRAVYQMNCLSGTLVDDWLDLGAKVVNGTGPPNQGTYLNSMPTQYHHFLTHWLSGDSFSQANSKSFNDARGYFDIVYALEPHLVTQSQLHVHGDESLKMSDR